MIYIPEIKEEAPQDILQASVWYVGKTPDLNLKFIQQLEFTLKSILNNPKHLKRFIKISGKPH